MHRQCHDDQTAVPAASIDWKMSGDSIANTAIRLDPTALARAIPLRAPEALPDPGATPDETAFPAVASTDG